MAINVALDGFSGPLDLLLQLVRRSQISVWEIRIESICEQFLAYANRLERLDVEQAADFMVMAATLIRIKARLLLPQPQLETDEAEPLDEEEELIARLLLYEGFQEAATKLEAMAADNADYYPRGFVEDIAAPAEEAPLEGVSLLTLALLAQEAYQDFDAKHEVLLIKGEEYLVETQAAHIRQLLSAEDMLSFFDLLSVRTSREEIVTTFLAVLELVRQQVIHVWQRHGQEILLARRKDK